MTKASVLHFLYIGASATYLTLPIFFSTLALPLAFQYALLSCALSITICLLGFFLSRRAPQLISPRNRQVAWYALILCCLLPAGFFVFFGNTAARLLYYTAVCASSLPFIQLFTSFFCPEE